MCFDTTLFLTPISFLSSLPSPLLSSSFFCLDLSRVPFHNLSIKSISISPSPCLPVSLFSIADLVFESCSIASTVPRAIRELELFGKDLYCCISILMNFIEELGRNCICHWIFWKMWNNWPLIAIYQFVLLLQVCVIVILNWITKKKLAILALICQLCCCFNWEKIGNSRWVFNCMCFIDVLM